MGIWVYGYMGIWVYGYMGIWVYGYMGIWVYGYMGIWVYGYMGIWVYGYIYYYSGDKNGTLQYRQYGTVYINICTSNINAWVYSNVFFTISFIYIKKICVPFLSNEFFTIAVPTRMAHYNLASMALYIYIYIYIYYSYLMYIYIHIYIYICIYIYKYE